MTDQPKPSLASIRRGLLQGGGQTRAERIAALKAARINAAEGKTAAKAPAKPDSRALWAKAYKAMSTKTSGASQIAPSAQVEGTAAPASPATTAAKPTTRAAIIRAAQRRGMRQATE